MSPALRPRDRALLARQGYLLLDGAHALAHAAGPAAWLSNFAGELAAAAWPAPVATPTRVQARAWSPYATERSGRVPFHNDGLYLHQPPRWLLLLCETPSAAGGDTLLCRGADVAAVLGESVRGQLRSSPVVLQVGDFRVCRPLVVPHPDAGDELTLLFDPALADDATLSLSDGASALELLGALRRAVAQAPAHRHRWRRGDLLVVDNLRVLHARDAYVGERLLHRVVVGPHAGAQRAAAQT